MIFLITLKWLQELQSNINSFYFYFMQINGFKYRYVIPIIQFLLKDEWFQVLLCNTNNSVFAHR